MLTLVDHPTLHVTGGGCGSWVVLNNLGCTAYWKEFSQAWEDADSIRSTLPDTGIRGGSKVPKCHAYNP